MDSLSSTIVTFNCGREVVDSKVFMHHLVNALSDSPSPGILILSLQEIAPIAYSFLGGSFLVPYLHGIRHTIHLTAKALGDIEYVGLITRNVGMTVLMAFIREDLSGHIRWLETGGVGVGAHEMGNKGAVGLRLGYATGHETVEMTFVAAHLAPMEGNLDRRNEDWKNIVRGLVFTPIDTKATRTASELPQTRRSEDQNEPLLPDSSLATPTSGIYTPSSHLVLAGDLNYRTSLSKPTPQDYYSLFPKPTDDKTSKEHYCRLLENDQLTTEIKSQKTAHGLKEAPIDFPPTYKYSDDARAVARETSTQRISTSSHDNGDQSELSGEPETWLWAKHRWPSWCDRILYLDLPSWMQDSSMRIQVHKYIALPLMPTSDHRPVLLSLSIPLTPIPPPDDEVFVEDWRLNPPYPIDPLWKQKRLIARRKEILVGILSYIGLTWEGRGLLLAIVFGALGGWAIVVSMLKM
ncbi:hypothetical protein MMC13_002553 [Lambiella insularis]|nr:hypothetical protein [Lambiella insularis]